MPLPIVYADPKETWEFFKNVYDPVNNVLATSATFSGSITIGAVKLEDGVGTDVAQVTDQKLYTLCHGTDGIANRPLNTDATGKLNVNIGSGALTAQLIRNDYTVTGVTTAAYVQLVASTANIINSLDVFDSSGQTLVFAVGAAGVEVNKFYIFPGGNGKVSLNIPAGSRLSVKAISANATVGELDINCFQ